MATFDELRIQELLKSFNNTSDNTGITSIDQQYTDPKYTYDGLYQENYGDYDQRMDPTMDPYGNVFGTKTRQASVSSAFPFDQFGSESTFDPRVGLPNQVPQINNQNQSTQLFDPTNIQSLIDSAALKNTQPQINNQVPLSFDTSYGVANEADEEQEYLPGQKKKLSDMGRNFGISSLIGMITGNPIIGLLSRGMKGLGALNNKMQNSDFGQSRTGAEYFMKRRERKQGERARTANADVYASADRQGFTNDRGGFSTNRADRAGTSVGSGQFNSKTSRGRTGY